MISFFFFFFLKKKKADELGMKEEGWVLVGILYSANSGISYRCLNPTFAKNGFLGSKVVRDKGRIRGCFCLAVKGAEILLSFGVFWSFFLLSFFFQEGLIPKKKKIHDVFGKF